jgi:type IV secretory pathway TraG/TraD family ATPase VirD4
MSAPLEELRDLLGDTAAGPYLAQDNGRFFDSVRSVTVTQVAGLEHLAQQKTGAPFSLRRWIRDTQGKGGALFLPYKANEIATLRALISSWMRLALFETMNGEEGDQRLWFVIDELDALGGIDGLKDALARLRNFGGTAEFASRLIGRREIIRRQVSRNSAGWFSRGHASTSESDHHVIEDAVFASQIEQLPDLTGYLKLASGATWRRVQIALSR